MIHGKAEKIIDILLNPHWLLFSLSGLFFFFFALNRGGANVFIWAGAFFVMVHWKFGDVSVKNLSPYNWAVLGVCAGLILMSLVFSYETTYKDRLFRLVKMLVIVFTVDLAGRTAPSKPVFGLFGLLLALSVIWQTAARVVFQMPYGTWSNPHYLANFAILALPLLFYYFKAAPRPYRFLFPVLMILAIDPVLRNASRPAFVALVVSTVFVVTFFVRSRYRWIGLLAVAVFLVVLVVTNYAGFSDHLQELIVNLSEEERVHIWSYSTDMLRDNSPTAWFVGNGIGSSNEYLKEYALPDPSYKSFNFPHNFLIQVLFENGIIGSVLVIGGYAGLLTLFVKLSKTAVERSTRLFVNCMMAVFLNGLFFTGLTVGFYSKYTLYPLGFIIGIAFVLAENVVGGINTVTHREPIPNQLDGMDAKPLTDNETGGR